MKKILLALITSFSLGLNAQYSGCDTTVIREYWYTFSETDTVSYDTVDVTYRTCLITSTTDSIRFFLESNVIGTYVYSTASAPQFLAKNEEQDTFTGKLIIADAIVNPGSIDLNSGNIDNCTIIGGSGGSYVNMSQNTPRLYFDDGEGNRIDARINSGNLVYISLQGARNNPLAEEEVPIASEVLTMINDTADVLRTLINTKADTVNQTFTGTIVLPSATSIGSVTNTEIGYLDNVTSSIQTQLDAKAVYPSQSGNNGKYLTTDGSNTSWATVSGGGSPGGSTGQFQFNDSGSFNGVANIEAENGNLRFEGTTTPSTPASGGVDMYAKNDLGSLEMHVINDAGEDLVYEPSGVDICRVTLDPINGNTWGGQGHSVSGGLLGTQTAATRSHTNRYTMTKKVEHLRTSATTSNIAGWYFTTLEYTLSNTTDIGGFKFTNIWGPATGPSTTANMRAFCGFTASTSAPTDVDPSTKVNMFGFAYDDDDTNIQFMHNDGSGTATKVDLGSNFAVTSSDRTKMYKCQIANVPNSGVVYYRITDMGTGDIASGSVNTNLPSSTTWLAPSAVVSVGGTSSVVGMAFSTLTIHTKH